jgi:hypothetical protein
MIEKEQKIHLRSVEMFSTKFQGNRYIVACRRRHMTSSLYNILFWGFLITYN